MDDLLNTFIQNSNNAIDQATKLLRQEPSPENNKQARILLTEARIWIAASNMLNAKLSELESAPQGQQTV